MKKTLPPPTTTYEFLAFPAHYVARDTARTRRHRLGPTAYGYKGYRFDCLSRFTFNTLEEALREKKRLLRIYKLTKSAKEYLGREDFLQILEVDRTPL